MGLFFSTQEHAFVTSSANNIVFSPIKPPLTLYRISCYTQVSSHSPFMLAPCSCSPTPKEPIEEPQHYSSMGELVPYQTNYQLLSYSPPSASPRTLRDINPIPFVLQVSIPSRTKILFAQSANHSVCLLPTILLTYEASSFSQKNCQNKLSSNIVSYSKSTVEDQKPLSFLFMFNTIQLLPRPHLVKGVSVYNQKPLAEGFEIRGKNKLLRPATTGQSSRGHKKK